MVGLGSYCPLRPPLITLYDGQGSLPACRTQPLVVMDIWYDRPEKITTSVIDGGNRGCLHSILSGREFT